MNNSAWQRPHHSASLDIPPPFAVPPPRTRHTSVSGLRYASTIDAPQSLIPPSLTPGGQRARIWDKRATVQRPRSSHGPTTITHRQSLYGDYFFSQHHAPLSPPPPLPQKPQALLRPLVNPLPPIPPKPPALAIPPASRIPLYPTSIPLPVVSPSRSSEPPEKDDLVLSLAPPEARRREQELIAQEEEDLAKALEESLLLSNSVYPFDERSPSSSTSHGSVSVDRASVSAIKAPVRPPEGESWLHLVTPTTSTSSQYSSLDEESQNEPDEEVSRQNDVQETYNNPWDNSSSSPPLYVNVVSNLVRSPPPSSTSHSTSTVSPYTPSPDHPINSPHLSSERSSSKERFPTPPFISRPSWSSVSSENSSSAGRSLASELGPVSSPTHPPASPDLSLRSSPALEPLNEGEDEDADTEPGPSSRQPIPLTANHYVEQEMLMGISLGFSLPVISTELFPMTGAMPNVITLPYGKAPVFHFQAPSWRRLLKLMAKLSGTRVEPTLEALNVARHDLKLRTVIQFVKIHHSASEWRTVLYLTTDYPAPSKMPQSYKYANNDVGVLPYSYTLSPLPTLLRDGSESPMAKYYVVPSTSTTPYPTLPINFPNLAMYLQSAVQDSRRAANDSSGGMRKLAQYIDGCYQTEAERAPIDQEVVSKKGVGGMIKRVMGRNKAYRRSGGNEEIYDLVTPFVSDEWG